MDRRTESGYKRLSGRGSRKGSFISLSLSRCSLYLAEDHVLAVDSNGFSEDYKRFYFSDIQAIITRKTRRAAAWSIVLIFLIACSLIGALFPMSESLRVLSWILTGTFFVFLLINVLKGPTCFCHILTAVQKEQLPSLNRLRVARQVIGTLKAGIANAQAVLNPQEIESGKRETIFRTASVVQNVPGPPRGNRPIRHENGIIHVMAFALLLIDGILTSFHLLYHALAVSAVSSMVTVLYSIGIVVALVRQHGSDIPASVRRITWASLGFVCLSYFLNYVLFLAMMPSIMKRKPEAMTQWDMYRIMLDLSPQDSTFVMVVYTFAAICLLLLGALGLFRTIHLRENSLGLPFPHQNVGGNSM